MDRPSDIALTNVGVWRGQRWILKGISWRVRRGACAAIIGPNGSGKSTLARVIAGHMWPSEGEVVVLDQRFGETDLTELRKSIRLLQPAGPYDVDSNLTAMQVVLTGFFGTIGLYGEVTDRMRREARRMMELVGLHDVIDERYATLSSGERLRALLARALVRRPRLLLLDEPTSGLDVLAREQVLATVQRMFENGAAATTVVLITHHIEELPPATSQVLLLSDGQIAAQGAPEDVMRDSLLSAAYNCPVQVRRSNGRFYLEVHPGAWEKLLKR